MNNECGCEGVGAGTSPSAGGDVNGAAAMETSWLFLHKLNIETPHDPAVPLLAHPWEDGRHMSTRNCEHECSQRPYS